MEKKLKLTELGFYRQIKAKEEENEKQVLVPFLLAVKLSLNDCLVLVQ